MTRLESKTVRIEKKPQEVFEFLADFNNYEQLMPEQVGDWISDKESCSFNIKGMASLGMAFDKLTPFEEVKIKKNGKAPFDFFLTCKIENIENNATALTLYFDADLNPFLKMMAEKPLTNFLNLLVNRYKEITSATA